MLGVLRDLAPNVVGDAIVEVPDLADQQYAPAPSGVNLHWVVRRNTDKPGSTALATLKDLQAPDEPITAFLVGEQQLATGGRRHLRNELGIPKQAISFCGYWRQR